MDHDSDPQPVRYSLLLETTEIEPKPPGLLPNLTHLGPPAPSARPLHRPGPDLIEHASRHCGLKHRLQPMGEIVRRRFLAFFGCQRSSLVRRVARRIHREKPLVHLASHDGQRMLGARLPWPVVVYGHAALNTSLTARTFCRHRSNDHSAVIGGNVSRNQKVSLNRGISMT